MKHPPEFAWRDLRARAGLLAFCAFAASCYPDEGQRDNFCLHLAGVLIHAGVDVDTAELIITTIAQLRDDPEDRSGKAITTSSRRLEGKPVTGLPAFLNLIGMEACEKRLRGWLGLEADHHPAPPADGINVANPNIAERTNQIEELLIRLGVGIYRRGSELVRVRKLETQEGSREVGLWRHKDLYELTPATPRWMAHMASEIGFFFRNVRGRVVQVAPTPDLMQELAETIDKRGFPLLQGITMTPTLTRNEPGYDPKSRMFLAFKAGDFPPSAMAPTREDAVAALHRMKAPFRKFPFVDNAALSVALSGVLSAVVRGQLRTCPLHALDAPAAGTGKTKIAEIIGIIATGVPPSGIAYSRQGDENEKRLVSILRAGDPVILIDNVTADLEGDMLCSALSQDHVQARILGVSETVHLSTRSLVLATGNNLRVKGDLTRRTVVCRLDAQMANPEERAFDFDPVLEVQKDRAQLVVDALTILRAFITAGRPVKLTSYGSFEDWGLVRGALVWLDQADPLDTKALLKAENPDLEDKAELMCALLASYKPGTQFTIKEIGAMRDDGCSAKSKIACLLRESRWEPKSAGRLLQRHKDLPFHGVTLRSKASPIKVQLYWLEGEPDDELRASLNNKLPM